MSPAPFIPTATLTGLGCAVALDDFGTCETDREVVKASKRRTTVAIHASRLATAHITDTYRPRPGPTPSRSSPRSSSDSAESDQERSAGVGALEIPLTFPEERFPLTHRSQLASLVMGAVVTFCDVLSELVKGRVRCRSSRARCLTFRVCFLLLFRHVPRSSTLGGRRSGATRRMSEHSTQAGGAPFRLYSAASRAGARYRLMTTSVISSRSSAVRTCSGSRSHRVANSVGSR